MRHIITLILAALALCGTAHATRFDCAPTSVVGTGFQFGVRAGDWEYAYSYTDFQASDNTTAGQGQYWYCRVGAPPIKPADFVPPAGWVAATVGVTYKHHRPGVDTRRPADRASAALPVLPTRTARVVPDCR